MGCREVKKMTLNFPKRLVINGTEWNRHPLTFDVCTINGGKVSPTWQDVILSGNTALTLVNAKADSLNYLKLFGGTELLPETYLDTVTLDGATVQRNVPEGYTQTTYTNMEAGSYIVTDLIPTYDYRIEFEFQTTSTVSQAVTYLSTASTSFRFAHVSAKTFRINMWGETFDANVSVADNTNYKFIYDNLTATLMSGSTTLFTHTFTSQGTTAIGLTINALNGNSITQNIEGIYLKAFKMWNNQGQQVANFISARQGTTACEYDKVTKTQILPTSGTFSAGSDVTAPTPDRPIDIVSNNGVIKANTNILDTTNIYGNYLLTDSGTVGNANVDWYLTNFIKVEPNTSYTFSFTSNQDIQFRRVAEYTSNNENTFVTLPVKIPKPTAVGNTITQVFTTSATTNYIRVSSRINDTNQVIRLTNYALNEVYTDGEVETVTDSLGNTASAEMLLAVDSYKDTQEVISGAVTRNIGITVLDGTENWLLSTNQLRFYLKIDDCKVTGSDAYVPSLCSHLTYSNQQPSQMTIGYGIFTTSSVPYVQVSINNFDFSTVNEFKQWLADQYANGTPVILVYPTSSATTESATPQVLTKSPVTQTAGAISGLTITTTQSSHTTPTPSQPLQINCNNGVLKLSPNLLDKSKFEDNLHWYIQSSTNKIAYDETSNMGVSDWTKVEAGQTYTFSTQAKRLGSVLFLTDEYGKRTGLAVSSIVPTTAGSSNTYTIPTGYSYIVVQSRSDYFNVDLQIEKGSTATTYRPYGFYADGTQEKVEVDTTGDYALAEMLLKISTSQDVQNVTTGDVTRNVGIKVLDGTESWKSYTNYCWNLNERDFMRTPMPVFCSHFEYVTTMPTGTARWGKLCSSQYGLAFGARASSESEVSDTVFLNLSDWTQFLADQYNAGTPIVIVYPLATATTESVTPQALTLQEGTNLVEITEASMDNLPLEVSYKAGVTVTVTEVENAQLSNSVEVTING